MSSHAAGARPRAHDPRAAADLVGLVGRLVRERSWEIARPTCSRPSPATDGLAPRRPRRARHRGPARAGARAGQAPPSAKNPARRSPTSCAPLRLSRPARRCSARTQPPPARRGRAARARARRARCSARRATTAARPSPTRSWATTRAPPRPGARWAISSAWRRPSSARSGGSASRRAAADAMRRFEALLTGGERRAALAAASPAPRRPTRSPTARAARRAHRGAAGAAGAPSRCARPAAPGCASRRCRPRSAAIRRAEVPLRDPARLAPARPARAPPAGGISIEDAGSRGRRARRRAPASTAPLRLRGEGELAWARTVPLRYAATDERRRRSRGAAGLDRELRALVGGEPVAARGSLLPGGRRAGLGFRAAAPRLLRAPGRPVRVDGHFVGPGCDLLHGDVDRGRRPRRRLRIEVE